MENTNQTQGQGHIEPDDLHIEPTPTPSPTPTETPAPVVPATPTPTATPQPLNPPVSTPVELPPTTASPETPDISEIPTKTETTEPVEPETVEFHSANWKKYIIPAAIAIGVIAMSSFAYLYFSGSTTTEDTPPTINLNNSLSGESPDNENDKMEELQDVTDEFKDIYATPDELYGDAVLEDTAENNTPPSIDFSSESSETDDTSAETPADTNTETGTTTEDNTATETTPTDDPVNRVGR